jgi:hypothetical protein
MVTTIIILLLGFTFANIRVPITKKEKDRRDMLGLKYTEGVITTTLSESGINAIHVNDLDKFMCLNANIRVGLTNFQELQYYGPLYLGTSKQKLNFVYDTGSSWLWFPEKD